MAAFLRDIIGGGAQKPIAQSQGVDDGDFADFATAPQPVPASSAIPSISSDTSSTASFPTSYASSGTPIVYTKWYRVWERTTPQDFYNEAFILLMIIILGVAHYFGTKTNRSKAKKWMTACVPILESEFAQVGFGGRKSPTIEDVDSMGLAKASVSSHLEIPKESFKETSPYEFKSYASGRQNIAFLHFNITLYKRYNPVLWFAETIAGFLLDSFPAPVEVLQATAYAFSGREKELVQVPGGVQGQEILETRGKIANSNYDDFVWAVVNKDGMKALRDDRYDISLTTTKDNPKLPPWATIMSESAAMTDLLLTAELVKAVEAVGDNFDYLIITDQPEEKPKKIEDITSRKRVDLSIRLSSDPNAATALFSYFVRLPDQLVSSAHFRPEVLRKVKQTREDEARKLQQASEGDKADERYKEREREKKEKRDNTLKNLSADEQRKFLERERKKDIKKQQKPR